MNELTRVHPNKFVLYDGKKFFGFGNGIVYVFSDRTTAETIQPTLKGDQTYRIVTVQEVVETAPKHCYVIHTTRHFRHHQKTLTYG